jgi:hypothetical protein
VSISNEDEVAEFLAMLEDLLNEWDTKQEFESYYDFIVDDV